MKQRWFRALFRRRVIVILLLVMQALFIIYLVTSGSRNSVVINGCLRVLSLLVALRVVASKDKGAYKTAWVFLILTFPIFGGLLYLLFLAQTSGRKLSGGIRRVEEKAKHLFAEPGDCYTQAKETLGPLFPQVRYLQDTAGFPVYSDTQTRYFSSGEEMYESLLEEMPKAKEYIFLEFFIIQEGVMWDSVLSILKEKAAQGVKVRMIYDDMGCFLLLPKDYCRRMAEYGIECVAFNPFRPLLTVTQNNRNHQKIISIDGKTAYTGGVNLADEYINAREKHGHWKDAGILLQGKAAWSFTLMFLEMWELSTDFREDFNIWYPWKKHPCMAQSDGFVQPYADSPMDKENVGEHVYIQILNQAQDYVYIMTPYLILDDSVLSALMLAAKRGVDVRIITPHRWDKWAVHMTTRSYYRDLIHAGIRIYEYTDGFIHSKTFVSDDYVGTVGTVNLDFRSLYLHFECGTLLFGSKAVMAVKEDFLGTIEICERMTEEGLSSNIFVRLFQDILRLFAPLM